MYKINKQYNRYEGFRNHRYIEELGDSEWKKEIVLKGYIKCKLMHGMSGSVIVPDFIFYEIDNENNFKWIQPLAFRANRIYYFEDDAEANIMIDISSKTTIKVSFKNSDYIRSLNDYSELYSCKIYASTDISNHFTGEGFFSDDLIPFIKGYHHTSSEYYSKILESGFLKNSKWNIGGTKELTNIGYVYFTPLCTLKYEADLQQVAMSSLGYIHLSYKNGIRKVKIYRRSVKEFDSTLYFWIDTQLISSSHLFKNYDSLDAVYYQVCSPFIHRVGMIPDTPLVFNNGKILDTNGSKKIDYIIVGDSADFDGIYAPYDEENTSYIFKVEKPESLNNLFHFWLNHANTDQFTNKEVEFQEFLHSNTK